MTASRGMRPVDFGFVIAGAAVVLAVLALAVGHTVRAGALAAGGIGLFALLTVWHRRHPSPMPFACRWVLGISPLATNRLKEVLRPSPGERMLEIGPGLGHHALAIAPALRPGGELEVLDVQQEMLDAVMERVRAAGVDNVFARQGDASALPFELATFDAVYMSAVLGEIPDRRRTLRELHRVVKPSARVVIAEVLIDPDYIPHRRLVREFEAAGFIFEEKVGTAVAYAARFRAAKTPTE